MINNYKSFMIYLLHWRDYMESKKVVVLGGGTAGETVREAVMVAAPPVAEYGGGVPGRNVPRVDHLFHRL